MLEDHTAPGHYMGPKVSESEPPYYNVTMENREPQAGAAIPDIVDDLKTEGKRVSELK